MKTIQMMTLLMLDQHYQILQMYFHQVILQVDIQVRDLNEILLILMKLNNKVVQPEELTALAKFADAVERRLMAKRLQAKQARLAEINAVKSTLPPASFKTPISALDLPEKIVDALQELENVGEIMWRFLIDERRLRLLLKDLPEDSLMQVQAALDRIVIPDEDEAPAPVAASVAPVVTDVPVAAAPASEDEDVVLDAFPDEPEVETEVKPQPRKPVLVPKPVEVAEPEAVEATDEDGDDDSFDENRPGGKKKQKKKERQQRRQLIFDEEIGQVIAKRRRKGGRDRDGWDDE